MKTTLITFIAIIICSCSSLVDEPHFEVTKELKPSVTTFYREAKIRNFYVHHDNLMIELKYNLKDNNGPVFGLTTHPSYSNPITLIQIDQKFCESLFLSRTKKDSLVIEYTLFHEFGHFIGRIHDDSHPTIMNSKGLYSFEYSTSDSIRTELLNELFRY